MIGIVFGLVVGVAIGNGVIAPRLQTPATTVKASLLLSAAVPTVAVPAATASAPRLTAEAATELEKQRPNLEALLSTLQKYNFAALSGKKGSSQSKQSHHTRLR